MLKTIIALLLFALTAQAQSLTYEFNHLSKHQITVLKKACLIGLPDNLCLSMSAIVWQESDFGVWNINFSDQGASWYGIRSITAMKYIKPRIRNTQFNRNRVGEWLIDDENWAGKIALSELKFWLKYSHGRLSLALSHYNAGYGHNKRYAKNVMRRIMFLKQHIKF